MVDFALQNPLNTSENVDFDSTLAKLIKLKVLHI